MEFLHNLKPPNCCLCRTSFLINAKSLTPEYRTPYLLKCGHSSCKKCLINELTHKNEVKCQICNEVSTVPNEYSAKNLYSFFPVNFFLLGMLQYFVSSSKNKELDARIKFSKPKYVNKKDRLKKVICHECLEAVADVHCKQCNVPYCMKCFQLVHNFARAFRSHTKIPVIDQVLNIDSSQLLSCSTHSDHQLEFYCLQCKTTICSRCIVVEHNGHKMDALENLDADFKEEFVQCYIKANKVLDTMKITKKQVETLMKENKESIIIKKINETISNFFIHIHGKISNIQNGIQNKMTVIDSGKHLAELMDTLCQAINDTETLLMSTKYIITDENKQKTGAYMCFIKNLKEKNDVPCYLVESNEITPPRFTVDDDIVKQLENLCAIELAPGCQFKLVKEAELPPGYEPPPVREMLPTDVWSVIDHPPLASPDPSPSTSERNSERAVSPAASSSSTTSCSSLKTEDSAIYTEPIDVGCSIRVRISHLISPSDFYVQRENADKKLFEFQASLRKSSLNNAKPPNNLAKGMIYLSLYEKDNKWYRVRILDIAEDKYKVLYIDFGNSEYVRRSRLRALPKTCLNIPVLAYRCKLHNCVPKFEGDWDPSAVAFMAEIIDNDVIHMTVRDRTPVSHIVELYRINPNNCFIDITEALIFHDFAVFAMSSAELPEKDNFVRMEPPAMQLPKQCIQYGDIFDAHISRVVSPSEFFAQNMMSSKRLIKMSEEMQRAYHSRSHSKNNVYDPKQGMHVAAQYSADKKWYRGKIVGFMPGKVIRVFFIDFGDEELVKWENIKTILPKFCTLAPQAIRCVLSDVQPLDDSEDYSEAVCEEFKQMIFNKKFKVVVESVESDFVCAVLYESFPEADICINALLVRRNLAVSTGSNSAIAEYPKIYTKRPDEELYQCELGVENTKKEKKIFEPPEINQEAVLASLFKAPNGTTRIHIFVKRLVSPGEFYVTPAYFKNVITLLEAGLQKFYERSRESENKNWAVDDKCAVKVNGKWFRAIVLDAPEDSLIKVSLLDEGMEASVDKKWVRPLHQKFMTVNDGVTRCHLGGLEPAQGTWSSMSISESNDFINNHESLYMCQLGKSEDGTSFGVELFARIRKEPGPIEPNIDDWKSLNHYLRILGLAKADNRVKWDCEGNILNLTELGLKEEQNDEENSLSKVFSKAVEISPECEGGDQSEIIIDDSPPEVIPDLVTVDNTTLVPIPRAWLPAPPLIHLKFVAAPTYVDSECCVYLHDFHKSSVILEQISDALCTKYDKSLPKPYDSTIQPGDICIAQFHMDKKWYRAILLEIKQEFDEYVIQFVDYGNIETCKLSELRKIPVTHQIPIQAVKCCFHTLNPVDPSGVWKLRHIEIIQYTIVDKNCQIELVPIPGKDVYGIKKLKLPDGRNYVDEIVREGFAYYKDKKDIAALLSDAYDQEGSLVKEIGSVSEESKDIRTEKDSSNAKVVIKLEEPINKVEVNQQDAPIIADETKQLVASIIAEEENQIEIGNNDKENELNAPINDEEAHQYENTKKSDTTDISEEITQPDAPKVAEDIPEHEIPTITIEAPNLETPVIADELQPEILEIADKILQIKISKTAEEISQIDGPKNVEKISQIETPNEAEEIPRLETPKKADEILQHDVLIKSEEITQNDTPNNDKEITHIDVANDDEEVIRLDIINPAQENIQFDIPIKDSDSLDVVENILSEIVSSGLGESVRSPEKEETCIKEEHLTLPQERMQDQDVSGPFPKPTDIKLIHWSLFMDKLPEEEKPIFQYKELSIPENVEVLIVQAAAYLTPTKVIFHIKDAEDDPEIVEKIKKFHQISATLQVEAPEQPPLSNPAKYMACVAQFSTDGLWYRAFILKDPSGGKVQIQYVDYGNVEDVPVESLREIKKEWLDVESMGLLCELYNVDYTDEISFNEVIDSLAYSLRADSLKAVVKNRSPLQVVVYSGDVLAYERMLELGLFFDL